MTEPARKIRLVMELRRLGIVDTRVLAAIERVPREEFVLPALREHAYENVALPLTHGQTISQPYVVAFMTQALAVGDRHKVLEVGTGSGYQAAVLSHLCRRVYTIERFPQLLREAEGRFEKLKLTNVTSRAGDGYLGWPEQAPFDRIMVTAAAASVPETLRQQLAVGGILVMPVGEEEQEIVRIKRDESGFQEEKLLPVRFVPLVPGLARGQ